ncbi:hypothetical protein BJX64DRAFT_65881 [Aspergillus heterothallicus]
MSALALLRKANEVQDVSLEESTCQFDQNELFEASLIKRFSALLIYRGLGISQAAQRGVVGCRPISCYATCQNCEKEYDISANSSNSGTYDPENCEPTEATYADIYDDDYDPDTPENREAFPDRFEYQCCGGTIAKKPHGCETDRHCPVP